MKFQLKTLAATLILSISLPATAGLSLPNMGNGSLMLEVMDRTANVSALFDLGLSYNDFNQLIDAGGSGKMGDASESGHVWNLAGNKNYSASWAQLFTSGATISNLKYAVIAADNLGAYNNGEGAQGYITSYASAGSSVATAPLVTALGLYNTYVSNATSVNGMSSQNTFPTTLENGASFSKSINSVFNVNGKLNNTGNYIFGNIGSSLQVEQVVTGLSAYAATTTYLFPKADSFTLSTQGTLVYAVPEANTSSMMLAGLGLMGFIANRRKRTI